MAVELVVVAGLRGELVVVVVVVFVCLGGLPPVVCLAGKLVVVVLCLGGLPPVLGGFVPPDVGVTERGGVVLLLLGLRSDPARGSFCLGGVVDVWVWVLVLGPLVLG